MVFVLSWRMLRRPCGSGTPSVISRSKRPKRRRDGSRELGRFVAASTMTLERGLMPSISVRSWETTRFSTSPREFSREPPIVSISSMKTMAQPDAWASSSAFSKAIRRFFSDSPAIADMISGPLMSRKNAPVSLAMARPMVDLPQPGGPCIRIPFGGFMPRFSNRIGCFSGSSTSSRICCSSLSIPPRSE